MCPTELFRGQGEHIGMRSTYVSQRPQSNTTFLIDSMLFPDERRENAYFNKQDGVTTDNEVTDSHQGREMDDV